MNILKLIPNNENSGFVLQPSSNLTCTGPFRNKSHNSDFLYFFPLKIWMQQCFTLNWKLCLSFNITAIFGKPDFPLKKINILSGKEAKSFVYLMKWQYISDIYKLFPLIFYNAFEGCF